MSGIDNLRSLAALAGGVARSAAEIDELIDLVGLTGRGEDRYGAYSLGMKQRLGIAAALLGDPELVILDEPTNGLDPMGMQDIRNLIKRISGNGRTVIVSSHLLSELEQVCDWLIVLDRGGLVHLGPPETLGGSVESLVLRIAEAGRLDDLAAIAGSAQLPVTIDADRRPADGGARRRRRSGPAGRRDQPPGPRRRDRAHGAPPRPGRPGGPLPQPRQLR